MTQISRPPLGTVRAFSSKLIDHILPPVKARLSCSTMRFSSMHLYHKAIVDMSGNKRAHHASTKEMFPAPSVAHQAASPR